MSGIYGIINLKGNPVDKSQMDKMEELLIHRGVDGKAQWIDNSVGLGHLKLEITPESEYERLPLEYKQWVITADARIDNRDELHEPLSISGEEQPLTPDTTYIVKAYEKWGKDCVKHLIGDFAFAIWDKVEKTLFCARDHIGVKPFFYLKTEDKFIFASELKTIVELREIPIELNESKLGDFMFVMQDIYKPKETIFNNIKRLLPSTFGFLNKENFDLTIYWQLQHTKEIKYNSTKDYLFEYRKLIEQAVECRIRTNFSIGVTLSGGLDSSSIACIASRKLALKNRNLYSVSSVLPIEWTGIEKDERIYINEVINQEKNIIPYFVTKKENHFFDNLDEILYRTYFPVNSFYNMDITLAETLKKESNVRVILSGFTGDIAASQKAEQLIPYLMIKGKFFLAINLTKKSSKVENSNFMIMLFKGFIKAFCPTTVIFMYHKIIQKYNPFEFILNKAFDRKHLVFSKYRKLLLKYSSDFDIHNDIIDSFKGTLKNLEEINIQKSHLGVEENFPLADIRILEYLVNIPVQQFRVNGWKRGLLRFSMENILPKKIQYRLDKYAYMPNYNRNIISNSEYLSNELKINKYCHIYLNIPFFDKILKDSQILKNWVTSNSNIDLILIVHELIILRFVNIIFNINSTKNEKK